jgi:hypothetical protein
MLKATLNLCVELFRRSHDDKIMATLAWCIHIISYVWIAIRNFLPHLHEIKVAFCVDKNIKWVL